MMLLAPFVYNSCHTRVALVQSHLCCARVACVALVLNLCRSCRTRVAHVWHSCCKIDINSVTTKLQESKDRINLFAYTKITGTNG